MVVIKDTRQNLNKIYGAKFLQGILKFSTVIGYSVEEENDEIKVEFNPDRPDLFSFNSLWNAIEVFEGKKTWNSLQFSKKKIDFIIDQSARTLRPFTVGLQCEGKPLGMNFRDLIEFQERIHFSIGKDRSKVSIGIHDTVNIVPPVYYRAYSSDKIIFTSYDGVVTGSAKEILSTHPKGVEYAHLIPSESEVPIIEDSKHQVMSMPPVINGNTTTVTPGSSNFFIDLTGNDLKAVQDAFYLLAYYFWNLGYSLSASNLEDFGGSTDFDGRMINVKLSTVAELIGVEISGNMAIVLLGKMGYKATAEDNNLKVMIPGNRVDVMGPADIIEDLAKAYGYDNIPTIKPTLNLIGSEDSKKTFLTMVRGVLVGLGYQETMSYVVTTKRFYENDSYVGGVQVKNPKSADFSVVRDRLVFGLLDFLRINKRRNLPQSVFEVGEVVIGSREATHLCVARTNFKSGFSDMRQLLEAFLVRLGITTSRVLPQDHEILINGRSGDINVNGVIVGMIGEVNPITLESFELRNPVSLMEIDLDKLQSVL